MSLGKKLDSFIDNSKGSLGLTDVTVDSVKKGWRSHYPMARRGILGGLLAYAGTTLGLAIEHWGGDYVQSFIFISMALFSFGFFLTIWVYTSSREEMKKNKMAFLKSLLELKQTLLEEQVTQQDNLTQTAAVVLSSVTDQLNETIKNLESRYSITTPQRTKGRGGRSNAFDQRSNKNALYTGLEDLESFSNERMVERTDPRSIFDEDDDYEDDDYE